MAERFVSRDQARHRLRVFYDRRLNQLRDAGDSAPTKHIAEDELGITTPYLCRMLNGSAPVSPEVARAIGLQPVKGFLELE